MTNIKRKNISHVSKGRNYFERPFQDNGRRFHDYGRSQFTGEQDKSDYLYYALIAIVVAYFAWQFTR